MSKTAQKLGSTKRRGRKSGTLIFGTCVYKVLKVLAISTAIGVALTTFLVAPNLIRVAAPLFKHLADSDKRAWQREREKIKRAIQKLQERRLIEVIEKDGEIYLKVTAKGRATYRKFDIANVILPKKEEWDEQWRLVIFDIPEKYKSARNSLRQKFLQLGFYPLQKSAFIYPFGCQDEVDFVAKFFGVSRFVEYVECSSLGLSESRARVFFKLLL